MRRGCGHAATQSTSPARALNGVRSQRRNDHDRVGVHVAWDEAGLRAGVKKAGGIWRPRQKLWEIPWSAVRTLGIGHRVVTG